MTSRDAPAAADPAAVDPGRLFARLAGRRGLVLAVSGGPDSTALMLLVAGWAERPPVLVVSVDHGLRPEAAEETRLAAANAARLGLPSRIVRVVGLAEGGNLQDRARRARYHALAEAAREAGFDTIVTAHHRDDQAETFLLRLARGSGVYGLAAMREEGDADGISLARPLLAVAPGELARIAAASGLPLATDPSNADPRFDRVRLRAAMPYFAAAGMPATVLAETAKRLARAADALDHYASALLAEHFSADAYGRVSGRAAGLRAAPEEVALRALARLLQAVGGGDYTPALASLEALLAAIRAAGEEPLRRTLAGVEVSMRSGTLSAEREFGRSGIARRKAEAGATLTWDRRFRVEVPGLAGPLDVAALEAGGRMAGGSRSGHALRTLPGLYRAGILVAAPDFIRPAAGGMALAVLPVRCLVGQRLGLKPGNPGGSP